MITHYATSCPTKPIFNASLCTRHMKSTSKYCSFTSNIVLSLYYVNLAIGITIRGILWYYVAKTSTYTISIYRKITLRLRVSSNV